MFYIILKKKFLPKRKSCLIYLGISQNTVPDAHQTEFSYEKTNNLLFTLEYYTALLIFSI